MLGNDCVILLWHSLCLPYRYYALVAFFVDDYAVFVAKATLSFYKVENFAVKLLIIIKIYCLTFL